MVLFIVIFHKRMGISLWISVCFSRILKKFQGKIVMILYYKQYISLQLSVYGLWSFWPEIVSKCVDLVSFAVVLLLASVCVSAQLYYTSNNCFSSSYNHQARDTLCRCVWNHVLPVCIVDEKQCVHVHSAGRVDSPWRMCTAHYIQHTL